MKAHKKGNILNSSYEKEDRNRNEIQFFLVTGRIQI